MMTEDKRKQRVFRFEVKGGPDGEAVREVIKEFRDVGPEVMTWFSTHGESSDMPERIKDLTVKVQKLADLKIETIEDGPVTDLLIRGMDNELAAKFKTSAGARGLKYSDYLSALIKLHEAMRTQADSGNAFAKEILDELELGSITI